MCADVYSEGNPIGVGFLPTVLHIAILGIGLAAALLFIVTTAVTRREDPLLLVGRITAGLTRPDLPIEGKPMRKSGFRYLEHGSLYKITMHVDAACRIRADGTLYSAPTWWQGMTEIGAARRLHRHAIEGEHAVVIAAMGGPDNTTPRIQECCDRQ